MSDELLRAVNNLTSVVRSLEKTLREDYPKRAEIERNFATRKEAAKRRKMFIVGTLAGLIISTFLGFFATVTTVSVCFISADARANKAPGACNILPGYREAIEENKKVMEQFMGLLKQPAMNNKRLDRIERRLNLPPIPAPSDAG